MRRTRFPRGLLAVITALTLLLGLASQPQPAAAATKGSYTILIFMNGSDLESLGGGAATRDLAEMLKVGSNEQVNILVETLGTKKWTPSFISGDRNQRWRVEKGFLRLVDDTVGRRDLADPNTLKEFIRWGMEHYPAERYGLIFWNHGGGPVYGYGRDETNPTNPTLSLAGITQGIGDALAGTGEQFELIGFDTCLMGSTEVGAALSPYARYLVASEEVGPAHGWNFTPVLQALHDQPDMTGDRLGQIIADNFKEQAKIYGTDKWITLSVIDLGKIQSVVEAWQDFLAVIEPAIDQKDEVRALQEARQQAESYGGKADLVDLHDLVTKAASLAPAEAEAVASRVKEAVVYNMNSIATPRATGLSVYFPHKGTQSLERLLELYAGSGFSPTYQGFLSRYVAAALTETEPVQFIAEAPVASQVATRSTSYAVQVNPNQADEVAAVYSILGMINEEEPDDIILLSYDNAVDFDPETGEIADEFTDYAVTLNGHYVAMYLEEEGETYDRYAIPIELNGEDVTLMVLYDYETDEDVIVGAWPGLDEETHTAEKEIIQLKYGDRIKPLFEFYNPVTDETGHYEGEEFILWEELSLGYTELPEGLYLYGFHVVDFAGNESFSDFTEVEVVYEEEP